MFQSMNQTSRKRLKIAAACTECRRKKTKCNGEQPCTGCQKAHVSCQYHHNHDTGTATSSGSQFPHCPVQLSSSQHSLFAGPRTEQRHQMIHREERQQQDTIRSIEQRLLVIEDILRALLASIDQAPHSLSHLLHDESNNDHSHVPARLPHLLATGPSSFVPGTSANITAAADATKRGQERQHLPSLVPPFSVAIGNCDTSYNHRHQHRTPPSIQNLVVMPTSPISLSSTSSNHSYSSSSVSSPPPSAIAWATIDTPKTASQLPSSPSFWQKQQLTDTQFIPHISSAFHRVQYSTKTSSP
ncbi:hypothetical protein BCR43DRAFT_482965 [Syncephalastrum racemosum]|uniref:Zn(2)-C6 fungal-type domain-containing protein n=1 Tax=Syncephalastrum racemosum TaxID=13706 RepID=A0A1X2HUK9_SYNRA|nr:hypothetical protein BCR43DRAFT_482965 [Syncephalastrum racemosum]